MKETSALLGALLLVGGLAGCSADPPTSAPINSSSSDKQTGALSDGSVSSDEYQAGFRRYQQCLADAGYELLLGDESGYLVDYSVPDAAVSSGTATAAARAVPLSTSVAWEM